MKQAKRYFTGKPCKRGHVSERYVATRVCIACQSEYRSNNIAACKANEARSRAKHHEIYSARAREWREKNPEKQRQAEINYRANNVQKRRDTCARYRAENLEKERAYRKKWSAANKPLLCAKSAKRRAAKKKAQPIWANETKMADIYNLAAWMTEKTGVEHHVDHIVPLQSKKVCGLHCEQNMAVVPGHGNLSKGNRYWPDMFD